MTHPITPPPELVEQWYDACILEGAITYDEHRFAAFAAQWGADQELEGCCEWLAEMGLAGNGDLELLRADRRPKPPSLKEQALAALGRYMTGKTILTKDSLDTIHRALEQLDD